MDQTESRKPEGAPVCGYLGCTAASLQDRYCLGHASEGEIDTAIVRWRHGAPLDARRVYIDEERLALFLSVLSKDDSTLLEQPLQQDHRPAFCGKIMFDKATFATDVDFGGITFEGPVSFDGARFCGSSRFAEAIFADHADFDNAKFKKWLSFRGATFQDHAGFQNMSAEDKAVFASAVFEENVDLEGATFAGDVDLREASFQFARVLGPVHVGRHLSLDDCVFSERVRLDVTAESISANFAIFVEGGRLAVGSATLALHGTNLGRAMTLSRLTDHANVTDWGSGSPRLLTLHGAQVSGLSISGFDLRDCRFFQAHGLESIVIEPSCEWRRSPRNWRCIDREIILEEHEWRALNERTQSRRRKKFRELAGWTIWSNSYKGTLNETEVLRPDQLAALYRALRKAREDNKDQAGAADLYYGEMEMRGRAGPLLRGRGWIRVACDKLVIMSYWLVSGYGLRASRAFLAWTIVVLVGGVALLTWGISPTPPFGRAILFSSESTSSLVRLTHLPKTYSLTGEGEVIQLGLRIVGPLLIGLLLLALRSRVKR